MNEDAIERAVESARRNNRLASEYWDTYPHVVDATIRGEVTKRYPSGTVEVTVLFDVDSGPTRTREERGFVYWYGAPCERCLGERGTVTDGKRMWCEACSGTGVRRE